MSRMAQGFTPQTRTFWLSGTVAGRNELGHNCFRPIQELQVRSTDGVYVTILGILTLPDGKEEAVGLKLTRTDCNELGLFLTTL